MHPLDQSMDNEIEDTKNGTEWNWMEWTQHMNGMEPNHSSWMNKHGHINDRYSLLIIGKLQQ
jgi:hypothetical protein